MAVVIGVLWMLRGGSIAGAATLAVVCLLHWPADVFTGFKPTTFHGPWIGLYSYRHPVSDLLLELGLLVGGWLLIRRRANHSFTRWWLIGGAVLQLAFVMSMYWGAEFYVGHQEWTWNPTVSLRPQPHTFEQLTCKSPNN
jgi:hypothetical protein